MLAALFTGLAPMAALPQPALPPGSAALLKAVQADAAQRARLPVEAVETLQFESVTWRDGSLGCPQPGASHTQALIPGYRVILRAGTQNFRYHASRSGAFVLCLNPAAGAALPETGT